MAALGERLSLHELLVGSWRTVRGSADVVASATAKATRLRPGFAEFVRIAEARGVRVAVVSSGLDVLIDPILRTNGVADVELHCNRLKSDGDGWEIVFRDEAECERCGEPCKRTLVDSFKADGEVTYVGDGYSDVCAALAASRRFARRRLAATLARLGEAYEPFETFGTVAAALGYDAVDPASA